MVKNRVDCNMPAVQQGQAMVFIWFQVDRDSLYFMHKSE